jgi:hypothetical protein
MGDAFVAIDAGLFAVEQETLVGHRGPRRLLGGAHRFRCVLGVITLIAV